MNNNIPQAKFIKPFSKGQITLPKDYREYLGIDEDSWLKVSLKGEKVLLQPVEDFDELRRIEPEANKEVYLRSILKIKSDWFDEKEMKRARKGVERRLTKNEKDLA